MKEVATRNSENGFTEISSDGLKDATIVTKGAYSILMKMKNVEE